ncbi:MAG TPA: HAD hydrolase-like protein [Bryobacteraceae bacterium]|jgi:putative hydrolase of the HAD superfamily|nr:HAD hydrolase-like protein [Bryobacteraceae bacterium]
MIERQNLIIDADDTLWENNIYFEQAFDDFCAFLDHSTLTPSEIRAILDEIELVNNKVHGYGSLNFGKNMRECYQRLSERHICDQDLEQVMLFATRIMEQPIEVIDGVEETLIYLATRHNLLLFTKGHPEEQKLKIERSGLAQYFGHTAIVREKDPAAYRELVASHGLEPPKTWMVGNSPKSDINAALGGGINAVYVPHPRTWHLEKAEFIDTQRKLLQVERFVDLQKHF